MVHQWSKKQPRMPSTKDDLLLKFYAFDDIDIPAMMEQMSHRIEQHETRLQRYLKIKARHYDNQDLTEIKRGKLIALEMGIENEKGQIAVFAEALSKMRAAN